MTTRILSVLAFVMLAAAMLFAGTPIARADVSCSGTLGGGSTVTNISGNVTVPAAASCILSFVNVTGNVTTGTGSSLLITAYTEPSTIGGSVIANNCASALLQGNVTVGGNVQITSCTGNGPNGFQGPDIVITGSFTCQSNVLLQSDATPCVAWLGKVGGTVTVGSNSGQTASDVSLVTVGGNLVCQSNSPGTTNVHGPSWVDGTAQGQCATFTTTGTSISSGPVTPVSCAALANLPASGFPVPNTFITSAVDTPASGGLPERCIINGTVNAHISPVDSCTYQNGFQVQLPLAANWNGRFMFQGGGGTEGSVPTATGTDSGSAGSNFGILNGYAVVSQDGGHENTQLTACGKTTLEFYLDPMGTIGNGYQSIEVAALTAKYLISQYYGSGPNRSYWVGCSEGGRQGMVMSEIFPSFFDGIVAGDPVYDVQAVNLSEIWSMQQIQNAYLAQEPPLPPITYVSEPPPQAHEPILYPAFPISDQALFETALLQACDALDGVNDGVVDNVPACQGRFDPATATYTDYTGALGPANTTYPLQCPGAKNATCLLPAQIQAAKKINQGARNSQGTTVQAPAGAVAPDHVDNTVLGYRYDGGFMTTVGVPSRNIGSATSPPSNEGQVAQLPYGWITPPNPAFDPLSFNFDTGLGMLTTATPKIQYSTSLDITHFVNYGHKIIWYHGAADPGPPVTGTINYYNQMAGQHGGLAAAQNFSRFYPVPNLDHCTGGATTDQFDMLTPLVNWVENATPPAAIPATGTGFTAATYQALGNYITGSFINAPTTRSRLLCPYPQQARFTGKVSFVNGVPVASTPSDLANAANYTCMSLVQVATHDFNGDGNSDVLWRNTSNSVAVWLMNGSHILQTNSLGLVQSIWSAVGQRDFNGDGDSDVLWRDTSGNVGMWQMNGGTVVSSTVFGNVATVWSVAATGDFNADGFGDILWRDTDGNVAVWLMNGTTILQSALIGNVPTAWQVVGADSKGDIFWYNTTTGDTAMWVMNGTKVTQSVDFGLVPLNWKVAGIGDFDGNGSTDILWRDNAGNVGMWLLNGTQMLSSKVIGNVPTSWTIVETGDYNGDGNSDILWVDTLGNVAAWFQNGTAVSSSASYGNVGTTWSVQSAGAD